MKRSLLLTTIGILTFLAAPSLADCLPAAPATGDVVICSGTDLSGFAAGNAVNTLTVTVDPGAQVSNAVGDAIRMRGTGNSLTNNGLIAGMGASNDGVDGGNDLTVVNNGTITATNKGIDADVKNNLRVINTGTIFATDKAIRNGDGNDAVLENSGLIESQIDEGFESGDGATVTNAVTGIIRASDDGVQVGENATILNYGLIESLTRGGGDEADPQDGIDIDSGVIRNYATGTIRSDDDAAIDYDASIIDSTIENFGTISGTVGILVEKGEEPDPVTGLPPPPNLAGQLVENHGLIEGRDGLALDVGAGNDRLAMYTGATLKGGADFGIDNDTLAFDGDFLGLVAGGSLLDGGLDFDLVDFRSWSLSDVIASIFDGEDVSLSFLTGTSDFSVNLRSWESYSFRGATYSRAELEAALAPVPLPAGILLMVPALGLLAAVSRRKRRG